MRWIGMAMLVAGCSTLSFAERNELYRVVSLEHSCNKDEIFVVSEETGAISLAEGGRFLRDLDEHELRQRLYRLLSPVEVGRQVTRTSDAASEASTTSADAESHAAASDPGDAHPAAGSSK